MAVADRAVEEFRGEVLASFASARGLEAGENANLLVQVDGALEGARLVAVSEEALRADQKVQGVVDLGTSALGAGAKKIPYVPEFAVNWTMEKVNEYADPRLADQVEEVQKDERIRLAKLAKILPEEASDAYEAYVDAHGKQSLSEAEFVSRKNTAFSNGYEAWVNLAEQEGESGT